MKKKILLGVLGGVAIGIASVPIIDELGYAISKKISKRIRKEIDSYEDEKEFDEVMRQLDELEEREDFLFDEALDDEFEPLPEDADSEEVKNE